MKPNQSIYTNNFNVYYGKKHILNDISMRLSANKAYAIIGPSGCGKTTLLYALSCLLPSSARTSGSIQNDFCQSTAIVLQDFGLFPWKTVYDNIALPFILKKQMTPAREKDIMEIIDWFKLSDVSCQFPNTLSGGQKQRVALARAWLLSTNLLLMDEPFSSLDAITRELLQEEVKRLYQKSPRTTVIVTHSIEEAVYLGQEIFLLGPTGKIINTFVNDSFYQTEARDTSAYYNMCHQLRNALREVQI